MDFTKNRNIVVPLVTAVFLVIAGIAVSSAPKADADEPHCVNGFITKSVERVCDLQQGTVCYLTHDNGHGIDMLSCVRP